MSSKRYTEEFKIEAVKQVTERVIERVSFRPWSWNCLKNSQRMRVQIQLNGGCTINQ